MYTILFDRDKQIAGGGIVKINGLLSQVRRITCANALMKCLLVDSLLPITFVGITFVYTARGSAISILIRRSARRNTGAVDKDLFKYCVLFIVNENVNI